MTLRDDTALIVRCVILLLAAEALGVCVRLIVGRLREVRVFPDTASSAWSSVILYGTLAVFNAGAVLIQLWGGLHRALPVYFLVLYSSSIGVLWFGWRERHTFRARERATALGDHRALVRARARHVGHRR